MLRYWQKWHPAAIGSIAMGHEIITTTVQLAQAASVVANGGMLVKPRLILKASRRGLADEADRKNRAAETRDQARDRYHDAAHDGARCLDRYG